MLVPEHGTDLMLPPVTKPCPFCRSDDVAVDAIGSPERPFFAVSCSDCEATGPLAKSHEAAIEAWNLRPDSSDGGKQ